MRQHRCVFLIALIAVMFLSVSSFAANDKGDELRRIDTDPGSSFTIQSLSYQFPLDTVAVPLKLPPEAVTL